MSSFPRITSLKAAPSCVPKTIHLIEKSFKYQPPHSFKTDFAPLIDESNHHNCFILLDENENVLAHVGAKDRNLSIAGRTFTFTMLGGIAVDESVRGQGHFQTLFQDVLAEKRSDTAFFLLWSDQEKLYQKYGFYLCGGQYELEKKAGAGNFKKVTFQQLSADEKEKVISLYDQSFRSNYLAPDRSEADWRLIEKISSTELFIRENAYFFKGKGQDLSEIIHEYGCKGGLKDFLEDLRPYGRVWTGGPLLETESAQYQYMLTPGDTRKFSEFIESYTDKKIMIRDVNVMKQEVYFDFNEETLALECEEFLRGVFGPGPFEELGEIKPLFLSGLDSI